MRWIIRMKRFKNKKMGWVWMKMFIKIILGIIILVVLSIGSFGFYMTRGLNAGKNMIINQIYISKLEDGVYKGKYSGGRWSNEVNVTLKNKKITGIDVVKSVVFEKPELTRTLINNVIEKQNTSVDVVSGATVTSKAYLKSIENALKNKK